MKKLVGVDIGGTNIKFGIFSQEGELLTKWSVPTDLGENGNALWKQVAEEIECHISPEEIEGIGMGIPGPVLSDGYVEACVNLHLYDFNPAEIMRKYFPGIRIMAANDANVAALGEQWRGAGQGHKNIGMITLGTGVGGSVILDGKIVYGDNGLSGEFGHVQIKPDDTQRCSCGGRGCLDRIASASGIVRCAKERLQNDPQDSVIRQIENLTARDVLEAAQNHDVIAEETVEQCMDYLAKVLGMVSYVVDPELFIIGGGVSNAGSYLTDMIQRLFDTYITLSKRKAKIVCALLGNDAGIYGAARMTMNI